MKTEAELHSHRAWLFRQIAKEQARRPYVRLPADHPDFDAEDLPHWWQRWLAEAVGAIILVAVVLAAAVLGNSLPSLNDGLSILAGWL